MSRPSSPKRNRHKSNSSNSSESFIDLIWDNPNVWKPDSPEVQEQQLLQENSAPQDGEDSLEEWLVQHLDTLDPLQEPQISEELPDAFFLEHLETLDPQTYGTVFENLEYCDSLETLLKDPAVLQELDHAIAVHLAKNPQTREVLGQVVDENIVRECHRLKEVEDVRRSPNFPASSSLQQKGGRVVDPADIPGPSGLQQRNQNANNGSVVDLSGIPGPSTCQQTNQISDHELSFSQVPDAIWNVLLDQVGGKRPEPLPPELAPFIRVEPQEIRRAKRFRTYGASYRVRFENIESAPDVEVLMHELFAYLIQLTFNVGVHGSKVGVTISHPALKNGDIFVNFCDELELTADRIMREIAKVMQSNADLSYDSSMTIWFVRVVPPQGGVRKFRFKGNMVEWVKNKCGYGGALIDIDNQRDNLCLARALVTAKAHLHRQDSQEAKKFYDAIRKGDRSRCTLQKREAKHLMAAAGLENHVGDCGLAQLAQLQDALTGYQIKLWDFPKAGCCIYRGPPVNQPNRILYLFHYPKHYLPITRMTAFFERGYFCEECEVPYHKQEDHRCKKKCPCCRKMTNCAIVDWVYCHLCNRYFKNEGCFNQHKQVVTITHRNGQRTETSVCYRLRKCKDCHLMIETNRLKGKKHCCGFRYCSVCRKMVKTDGHYCYMPVLNEKEGMDTEEDDGEEDPDSIENLVREREQADGEQPIRGQRNTKVKGWIFFDIESTQDEEIQQNALGVVYGHRPNLIIAHKICHRCKEVEISSESHCTNCTANYNQFQGDNCLQLFCEWLFQECHKGYVALAHNMRGYDGQFLLNYLHEHGIRPEIVPKGLEIMKMNVDGITVLDSLNFMPLPLASLPKAFGFTELQKGYFPYLFNTKENENYIGPHPEHHYYGVSSMKEEGRKKFFEWYNLEKNKEFRMKNQLISYCNSDVDILRKSCMKYRDLFLKETGVDPFEHCMTIASTCNRVFRKNFLQKDTIGIIPPGGYSSNEKQSNLAKKWLSWIAVSRQLDIAYVHNGKEIRVGQGKEKYKVDGQDRQNPTRIFEFNGCLWHGCPDCFSDRAALLPGGRCSVDEAYLHTIHRRQKLVSMGFHIEEMWECQLKRELAANPQMQQYFNNIKLLEPLSPRAAFYGGRTNASALYWRSSGPHERACYLDVCSLYPFVCKYGQFPKGHPTVVTDNFLQVDQHNRPYRGVMECTMLPPKQLVHPLLPFRSHGKLFFPLCKTCALEQNPETCSHSDHERALDGAWCTLEVYRALELGYQLVKIHQVWHYTEWMQYERGHNPDHGMFTNYINCFVKHKQQASGWPSNRCHDEYLREYKDMEGIELDPDKIEKNPGLRFLAKLCLNSFWGKFGQRNNMGQMQYFTDPAKYLQCIFDPANIIRRIDIINENMVLVEHIKDEPFVEALPTTNPVIAAYVTAQARLKLHSYLHQLGKRVFYYDTDSVIFLSEPGQDLPTGCFLGDLTDELEEYGTGSFIEEFVGAGPKNYAYAVRSTRDQKRHEVVKSRGFAINYTAGRHLNFQSMKKRVQEFVQSGRRENIAITLPKIRRDRDRKVMTQMERKNYRVVYDKRRVLADYKTLPFGYVD